MAKLLPLSRAVHSLEAARGSGGVWSLTGDWLVNIAGGNAGANAGEGRPVVLVQSEDVLLLAVPLPPMAPALRRRAALPFAVEEQIAQPLDQVHIALGGEMAPGVWLAGVVSHTVMAAWSDRLAQAGLERASLVPDVMALPVPDAGCWSVELIGPRAMVRLADGSGFGLPRSLLEPAWRAAGEPVCVSYGEPLAPEFAAIPGVAEALAARVSAARVWSSAIDLRQGRYAAPRAAFNPLWQRIAIVAALGALAHGAIAIADTAALVHLASTRAAQVRLTGASLQPPVAIGADLGDAVVALSPDPAAGGSSRFMMLLSRSAAALASGPAAASPGVSGPAPAPASAPTVWRSVSFDGAAGTLTIELEADTIADLQRMAQALTSAGLSAQPGSASTQGGKAVGSFVVKAL